jgi:hypothetical protein
MYKYLKEKYIRGIKKFNNQPENVKNKRIDSSIYPFSLN